MCRTFQSILPTINKHTCSFTHAVLCVCQIKSELRLKCIYNILPKPYSNIYANKKCNDNKNDTPTCSLMFLYGRRPRILIVSEAICTDLFHTKYNNTDANIRLSFLLSAL